jgi:eukaryotic-like serine/threonine-protein kinase
MTGWCGGSAGIVHLWTLAHELSGSDEYLKLAEQTAWNAWEEPSTIGSLCCGDAGRAYGLLNIYKHTGDGKWLSRALELANRSTAQMDRWASRAESLYKGKLGLVALAADLSNPEKSCQPMFEREIGGRM